MTLRKILDLHEGHWLAKSLDGIEKRFKTSDTAGRDAWSQSYAKRPKAPPIDEPVKDYEPDLGTVWRKVEQVIGNIFPDGDPIDWLAPWLIKQGVKDYNVGDVLRKAANANGYEDMYAYWDELKREHGGDELMEISNELLQKYKQAAALDAGAADKIAFDPNTDKATAQKKINQANKRFSGIVQATKKQFANSSVKENWREPPEPREVTHGPDLDSTFGDEDEEYLSPAEIRLRRQIDRGYDPSERQYYDEGSCGGINRSRPAQDVSYEKVLSDGREYHELQDVQKYVVVDNKTGEVVAGPYSNKVVARNRRDKLDLQYGAIRYRVEPHNKPGWGLSEDNPCWKGHKQLGMKDKDGKQVPNCVPVSENKNKGKYEKMLKDILARQDAEKNAGKAKAPGAGAGAGAPGTPNVPQGDEKPVDSKPKVESYNYHGYVIKYRDNGNGNVEWAVVKDEDMLKKSSSPSIDQAKMDAERFIDSRRGSGNLNKGNSVIDFNAPFVKEFFPGGETFFVMFHRDERATYIIISPTHFEGTVKSSIRAGSNFPAVHLSPKENRVIGLVPHGRYIIDTGRPDPIDDVPGAVMYPVIFQGEAYDKHERVHLKEPGFTVGSLR